MKKNSWGCGGCLGIFLFVTIVGSAGQLLPQYGVIAAIILAGFVVYAAIGVANSRASVAQWARFVDGVKPQTAYVVLDVETSGLSPAEGAEVVQFAVMAYDSEHSLLGSFSTLVKPNRGVGATHIHGISNAGVRFARRFNAYAPGLRELLNETIVVAHNASFDVEFLRTEMSQAPSVPVLPRFRIVDTLQLTRAHLKGMSNYKLPTCVAAVGLNTTQAPGRGEHDALYDTWCCAGILHAILQRKELQITDIARWG